MIRMKNIDLWYSKLEKEEEEPASYENSAADNESKDRIEVYNNDIYFYSEVKRSNNLSLNKNIAEMSNKYLNISNSFEFGRADSTKPSYQLIWWKCVCRLFFG